VLPAMGFFQRLFGALGMSSQACKILVVGLDDAGKTTIMNQIMPKKVHARRRLVPCRVVVCRAAVFFLRVSSRLVVISLSLPVSVSWSLPRPGLRAAVAWRRLTRARARALRSTSTTRWCRRWDSRSSSS
jgi:hypothetical protein